AGTQTIAERERNVVGSHDLADFAETRVEKTHFVMRETTLGHNRAAATDDSGGAFRSHRNERQTHAGVNRKVIDALLGLFDQSVAEDFPGQLFRFAANFF